MILFPGCTGEGLSLTNGAKCQRSGYILCPGGHTRSCVTGQTVDNSPCSAFGDVRGMTLWVT